MTNPTITQLTTDDAAALLASLPIFSPSSPEIEAAEAELERVEDEPEELLRLIDEAAAAGDEDTHVKCETRLRLHARE